MEGIKTRRGRRVVGVPVAFHGRDESKRNTRAEKGKKDWAILNGGQKRRRCVKKVEPMLHEKRIGKGLERHLQKLTALGSQILGDGVRCLIDEKGEESEREKMRKKISNHWRR